MNELNNEPSPLPLESEMAAEVAESGKIFDTVTLAKNTYIILNHIP